MQSDLVSLSAEGDSNGLARDGFLPLPQGQRDVFSPAVMGPPCALETAEFADLHPAALRLFLEGEGSQWGSVLC